ncbi:putative phage tail protein [Caballeronia sp. LZ001]|uniref:YmfQ family protein n=1 Tax=Caballeronia sp. LZ001 TaxID=3038553 RepID=UPI00285EB198|nr:putative phage tail protein [Caballeronia sp. LZ001]MDR5803394.1 DUF2313 domain-containing protein [Caballeronia sp. LZ001]
MSDHATLLGRLLPLASYDPREASVAIELNAEGAALDRCVADAQLITNAITPYFAHQLLPDWERVCGLTPSADATLQQRISAVVAKISETGGMSIPYFKQIAKALGYRIEIAEPEPFRVDENHVEESIWVEDIIYQWGVIVHGARALSYLFRVDESAVGEPLSTVSDVVIEKVFHDLKPADTNVYFIYLEN